jgi:hypothetical protein
MREDVMFKTCAFRKACPYKEADREPWVKYETRRYAHARCLLREKGEAAFDLLSLNELENFPALVADSAGLLALLGQKLTERKKVGA